MKTIAHISDLHFGTEDPAVEAALRAELDGSRGPVPSLVAISGDLTQRARRSQFAAARVFLDRLPGPKLVVPGNHDIPLFDVLHRFATPLGGYRHAITDELAPRYVDDELAVVGVTTAHPLTIKDGKITTAQIAEVRAELAMHPRAWKIVVAHHPFVLPAGGSPHDLVEHADAAIRAFREVGVDLILSGHLHVAYSSDVAGFRDRDRQLVAVAAGTCMSTRLRGEPNAYNLLRFEGDEVTIINRTWDGRAFVDGAAKVYRRQAMEIVKVATVVPASAPRSPS